MADVINAFPGYEYVDGHNMYRGVDLGKGGYVYYETGMHSNVGTLDIQSMHPNSIRAMNSFGEYTKNFTDLLDARVFIKHGDFDSARKMLDGRLAPYLDDESKAKELAQALKIAINSVYGLTAASFDNPFRDIRNKNNIVALRGALFMKTLQDEVVARGYKVVHIKTDSIKIPNIDLDIINFCMDFAKQYGYTFEHESTYDRMCLVNGSTFVAKYKTAEACQEMYGYVPGDNKKKGGTWTAVAAQFQVPYVFKKLFSHEKIEFKDLCETKEAKKGSGIYLDMNEPLPDVSEYEKQLEKATKQMAKYELQYTEHDISEEEYFMRCDEYSNLVEKKLRPEIDKGHRYSFVGKVGEFCPILSGKGGGQLVREQNGKYYAVAGSTGYRWLESEVVKELEKEGDIDYGYFNSLVDDAVDTIKKARAEQLNREGYKDIKAADCQGDFEWFISDDPFETRLVNPPPPDDFMNIPEDSPDEIPFT